MEPHIYIYIYYVYIYIMYIYIYIIYIIIYIYADLVGGLRYETPRSPIRQ